MEKSSPLTGRNRLFLPALKNEANNRCDDSNAKKHGGTCQHGAVVFLRRQGKGSLAEGEEAKGAPGQQGGQHAMDELDEREPLQL